MCIPSFAVLSQYDTQNTIFQEKITLRNRLESLSLIIPPEKEDTFLKEGGKTDFSEDADLEMHFWLKVQYVSRVIYDLL